MTLARRNRKGRLKNLRPFKINADGMPARMPKIRPPCKLLPPPPRGYVAALLRELAARRHTAPSRINRPWHY